MGSAGDPNQDNARRVETMTKETNMQLEMSLKRLQNDKTLQRILAKSQSAPTLPKKSAAQHFLDTSLSANKSPYDTLREGRAVTPDRLLRYGLGGYNTKRQSGAFSHAGINQDGEGRAGYLRYRGMLSPVQKYQQPVTSNQVVGWGAENYKYGRGNYNRKPLIEQQFYRTMNAFWKPM